MAVSDHDILSFTGYIPPSVSPNIKIVKWLPQIDLLGHKDIKAFVSHAGHNSVYESTYHGVPLVAFPLFSDQPANAKKITHLGLGLRMDHQNFTAQEMFEKIELVIKAKVFVLPLFLCTKTQFPQHRARSLKGHTVAEGSVLSRAWFLKGR